MNKTIDGLAKPAQRGARNPAQSFHLLWQRVPATDFDRVLGNVFGEVADPLELDGRLPGGEIGRKS